MANFKGINIGGFGGYELCDQILYNLKFWLDEQIVANGGFSQYLYNQDSFLADDESKLISRTDERYSSNNIWEGVGRSWVWESDLTMINDIDPPFRVSGVYIDGTFYTPAQKPHHVDYLNGRIIFEEPPDSSSDIRANYCSRDVHIGFADSEDFRLMMLESIEEFLTQTTPSGTPAREHQIILPSIFIDIDDGSARGLQLGGGQIKTRYITLHIFADNSSDRNLLMDWLDYQSRAVFYMADLNNITLPFDKWGEILNSATNWQDIVNANKWKKIRINSGTCRRINSLNTNIFRAQVKWECQIDLGGL